MAKVALIITRDDDGSIVVGGPIHDKLLCYGLLGYAQNAINNFKPQEASQILNPFAGGAVAPVGLDLSSLKAGGDDRT